MSCGGKRTGVFVYFILLVTYVHTHNTLEQFYSLISSRIIYDHVKNDCVEGDAEVTRKGEVNSNDYISFLMKTIHVNNRSTSILSCYKNVQCFFPQQN